MTAEHVARGSELSRELAQKVEEFRRLAAVRARAEADYRRGRAKATASARVSAKSYADAELSATASDVVGDLHLAFLLADAEADACKLAVLALRTRIEWGRSVLTNEREADRVHALGQHP